MARRALEAAAPGTEPAALDASPPRKGGVLSIVGPDGAGKTTLIDALVADHLGGAPILRMRRPGVLYRRTVPDVPVTEPHKQPPYPALLSLLKTGYIFVDVFLGWTLRIRPFVRRGGWVIVERGWWDIAVDPLRYRMRPHGRLLWSLGRLLPKPDLLLILEAPPEIVYARKTELTIDELARQMGAWRDHLPASQRRVFLDASLPAREVVRRAATELDRLRRDFGDAPTPGWTGVPTRVSARWVLPRAPRAVAASGLLVYQPINLRARAGWEAARLMARLGMFRLLPGGGAPPEPVRAALAPHVGARSTLSVARTNHPGRYVALVIGPRGECQGVGKVATDEVGRRALRVEARAVVELGPELSDPLSAPEIAALDDSVLLYRMAAWSPRARPWMLPADIAGALGCFYRAGTQARGGSGLSHGDFAPWNLLRTRRGWVVIDWEDARRDAPPFYDVWHFLVQGHALLRRPRERALFDGLNGRGWVGDALRAYAEGAGLHPVEARRWLPVYLEASKAGLDPAKRDGAAGLRARARLLSKLGPS
jgi:thymidylate kinase